VPTDSLPLRHICKKIILQILKIVLPLQPRFEKTFGMIFDKIDKKDNTKSLF